ncbi:ATP-binding cassette domain-containing protein [Vagococcus fluvialis]|uniref:ATP-binding cassette domain-containing protein n=1 Tax=Vagococcus fluvialis TaxID=2738 RepID=UPI00378FF55C
MELHIEKITKIVKNNYLLNNISMNLESGKIYGITGPNGSGKTMLLRALCGFIKLDSGTIKVDGMEIIFNKELPIEIGLIIENPNFNSHHSGLQNLKDLAAINNKIEDEVIINFLDKFGLTEKYNEKVKKYSLGMKQKLGIIQSIMEDQQLILLDEPTNALDKDSVILFKNIMLELKHRDKLIIIVSHNEGVLQELCDEIYDINLGKIGIKE